MGGNGMKMEGLITLQISGSVLIKQVGKIHPSVTIEGGGIGKT